MNINRSASCFLVLLMFGCILQAWSQGDNGRYTDRRSLDYEIQLDVINAGYNGIDSWFQPRAGVIPGNDPEIVFTMQKWTKSDVFFAITHRISTDLGKTWSEPEEQVKTLGRLPEGEKLEVGIAGFTPKWHARSGKLLGTGHTVRYNDNQLISGKVKRSTVWSVFDEKTKTWSPWKALNVQGITELENEGAGCTQRVDLPGGDILLPTYFRKKSDPGLCDVAIMRCRFNGEQLEYVAHGDVLSYPTGRGFAEPSLTYFNGRFLLTLRNDDKAYVAISKDGLHYAEPSVWRFDDGSELGSYNTQQHWVTHSDGLFLVYTRRDADNENVVRHRAPLFIARVDPEKLVVIRNTERVLVPNKGAQLGNFGVVNVNERETWVTTSEGMNKTAAQYGADGRVYAARIIWNKPNRTWKKY